MWIRSQDGSLYNLSHVACLLVRADRKGGESVDVLIARLADGTEAELGASAYGINEDALADAIRRREALIDVIAEGIVEAVYGEDEGEDEAA